VAFGLAAYHAFTVSATEGVWLAAAEVTIGAAATAAMPEDVVAPDDEATEAMPELSTEGAEVVAGVATVAIPEGVVAGAE
jgi:hypothetical protein